MFNNFHVVCAEEFNKNIFIIKSMDDNCVVLNGQTTTPYRSIGIHLVFSERERSSRSLYAVARPSVCLSVCLSSVTLVHPTQAVQIFGNVSTAFGTVAIR